MAPRFAKQKLIGSKTFHVEPGLVATVGHHDQLEATPPLWMPLWILAGEEGGQEAEGQEEVPWMKCVASISSQSAEP